MNNTVLRGRLGNDLELYSVGKTVNTKFSLAVTDDYNREKTHWFNCVVWGKYAETLVNLVGKGNRVIVQGRLENNNYTNKEGQEVRTIQVVATNVDVIDFKNDNQQRSQNKQVFSEQLVDLSDANLPF